MPPIGNCPTFSYHGSKAKEAKWLVSHFTKANKRYHRYISTFAGRANDFFRLVTTNPIADKYILNDKYNADWLIALRDYNGDWNFVDDYVDKNIFLKWRNSPDSIERTLAASYVCYHGNRYNISSANNYQLDSIYGSPNFKKNLIRKFRLAQDILRKFSVEISSMDYRDFLCEISPASNDILYFDPPYYGNYDQRKTYPTINHEEFCDIVIDIKGHKFISNYNNDIYSNKLSGWIVHSKERVSTAKQRQGTDGKNIVKTEILWEDLKI